MGIRRPFDESMLAALRRIPSEQVLRWLWIQVKADSTLAPRQTRESRRWLVLTERGDFDILTTGCLWLDTRERRGAASAIDLAMHLLGVSFVEAVRLLSEERLPIGVGRGSPARSRRSPVRQRTDRNEADAV